MKRVLLVFFVLVVVFGCSGCVGSNDVRQELLDHVSKKYNKTFVGETLIAANWAYAYDVLYAYPEGEPENKFEIHRYEYVEGNQYSDGYFGVLIKDEYQKSVADCITPVIGASTIYTQISQDVFADRLGSNTSVSDIYNCDEAFWSDSYIFTTVEKLGASTFSQEQLTGIGQNLLDQKLINSCALYILSDSDYASLSEDSFRNDLFHFEKIDRQNIMINHDLSFTITSDF